MNQKIKDLKGQKIAIHCPTEQEADELMVILDENGYKWCSNKELIENTEWYRYKENTCYEFTTSISFAYLSFFEKEKYKIITFKEFKQQYMKPQSFSIEGIPSLIKAIWEEMKAIGYTSSSNEKDPRKSWVKLSQNSGEKYIKNIEMYKSIFISYKDQEGQSCSLNFKLPEQWNEALQYVKDAYNSSYWEERQKKDCETITVGSQDVKVTIYCDGSIDYNHKKKFVGIIYIDTVKEIISKYIITPMNIEVDVYTAAIETNVRFIRIGCTSENNLFSINDLQNIVRVYNDLQ